MNKIEIGTKFIVKATPAPYKGKTFECVDVTDDTFAYKCVDQNGDVQFFSEKSFEYYGAGVIIISRPKYDKSLLKTAVQQTYQNAVLFGETAAPQLKAILKAWDVIERNQTIKFDGAKLEFVSQDSGKTRIVTASGCVESHCDCKNQYSYHKSLFAILTRYAELQFEASNVRAFRPKVVEVFEYDMAA